MVAGAPKVPVVADLRCRLWVRLAELSMSRMRRLSLQCRGPIDTSPLHIRGVLQIHQRAECFHLEAGHLATGCRIAVLGPAVDRGLPPGINAQTLGVICLFVPGGLAVGGTARERFRGLFVSRQVRESSGRRRWSVRGCRRTPGGREVRRRWSRLNRGTPT